jgi:asparagine synthase (glutamine-hydrolysing)
MCGICGIFDRSSCNDEWIADENVIWKMTNTLTHRGPDQKGVHVDGPMALGNTRLAIIDLSDAGKQPMLSANGDYAVSFNGEIYNYIELRQMLQKKGVRFRSNSDTEVLLQLYITKGIECLKNLRGMFAFAIWDRKKELLFLARDRAGEKPLVYAEYNGYFCFGSEIKSLLALPGMPRKLDPIGLHYGFHHVNVPAPYSAFSHIRKLRPAECMVVTKHKVSVERYWQPRFHDAQRISDPDEAVFELNRCLDETVNIICRSDVPIGAMLSGGLDSSAVVAAMHEAGKPVDTFCVSHTQEASDPEFAAARRVADHFQTRHHELAFRPEKLASVRDVVCSFDEPVATFVPLHAHTLSSMIRRHVKVALTGNGGDELFGGYPDHQNLRRIEQKMRLWDRLEKWYLGPVLGRVPLRGLQNSRRKYGRLHRMPLNRIAAEMRTSRLQAFYAGIYSDGMKSMVADCDVQKLWVDRFDAYGAPTIFDGFLFQQVMVGSQHSIVDIPDISGMANSLEYRSPFLDVKMMELAMRIAENLKVPPSGGNRAGKWILRQALKSRLPADIVTMKKSGFGSAIPYQRWFLNEWSEYVEKRLASSALADSGLFDTARLKNLYHRARLGGGAPIDMIWGVVMTSEWLDVYMNDNQGGDH